MRRLRNRGFTLIETLIVIVIIGALIAVAALAASRAMTKGRITTTENTLQLFSADMDDVLSQYGTLTITDENTARSQIMEFVNLLETYYLNCYFDKESLVVYDTFFEVQTSSLQDGWDNPFLFRYCFSEANAGCCLLISGGENEVFDCQEYTNSYFGDDILIAVIPKVV